MAVIAESIAGRVPERLDFVRFALALALAIIAFAAGCGGSFAWTGKWVGKRTLELPPNGNPYVMATLAKVELTILPNGRFELLESGVPKSGTVRTEGRRAYLKVTHFMDRPLSDQGEAALKMNQEIRLSVQKDGSIEFDDPGGLVREKVRLVREMTESQPGG